MEPRGLAISHRDNSKAPTESVPGSPEIFSNMANKHGDYRYRLLKPARGLAPPSLIVWRGYRSVSVYVLCQFTLGVNSSRYGRSYGWYIHPTSTSVPNANSRWGGVSLWRMAHAGAVVAAGLERRWFSCQLYYLQAATRHPAIILSGKLKAKWLIGLYR